ncbi:hypothetical protein [Cellulomonas sp.]|uniref:hypothetical protein n=1 Tax=Cellulomonas sp. TaxID=40001 RepID=UPI00258E37BC|nr:hypothetical protein [Cellulomonas sp.]MCR6689534.1 hypothetical protein [Cellulomonas sp.]
MSGHVLERSGVFRLSVAEGWTATGVEGHRYRLRHDGLDVRVDVSVHRRQDDGGPDARAVVLAFARDQGAPATLGTSDEADPGFTGPATARWQTDDGAWAAVALRNGPYVVLASAVAPDEESLEPGASLIGSLVAHRPPRRWWRRA